MVGWGLGFLPLCCFFNLGWTPKIWESRSHSSMEARPRLDGTNVGLVRLLSCDFDDQNNNQSFLHNFQHGTDFLPLTQHLLRPIPSPGRGTVFLHSPPRTVTTTVIPALWRGWSPAVTTAASPVVIGL